MRTRTNRRPVKPPEPTVERSRIYRGQTLARMSDGSFRVIFEAGNYMIVADMESGRKEIDAAIEFEEQEAPKIKPEYPRAGYAVNPPSSCEKKVKFEDEGNWWVECCVCVYFCGDTECVTHKEIMSRRSLNIKRTHYPTMLPKCPHCESEIEDRGIDQWIYACGTIADKGTNSYIRKCGTPVKPQRTRRTR